MYKERMIKIYRKVLVLALLALPLLSHVVEFGHRSNKTAEDRLEFSRLYGADPGANPRGICGNKGQVTEVKSMDGFYNPDQQAYLNSLKTLNPLDGVMVKVSQDYELKRTIKKSAILYHDAEKQSLADVLAIGNSAKGQIKMYQTLPTRKMP